ncbi:hypothetical protein EV656_101184 [Rhodovulum adriaticum]|uniref:Phage integrase family protein n=2 Tax=Rhodovulum adriaticum TaxID=35804 RepID=A0A4R2P0C7_RHOAD|nr:hypothetical protein [Rhodovulum adriaticum]TCP27281.1 hypothetical protein EV656_101184 [Rhodovulum adriaticum]
MRTLRKIGRYAICENRGKLHLRWTPPKQPRRSERLDAELRQAYDPKVLKKDKPENLTRHQMKQWEELQEDLDHAEKVARSVIRRVIDPAELVDPASDGNPTFREIWLTFERFQEKNLKSEGRKKLIKYRRDLYYKPYLWNSRMTGLSAAVARMVDDLEAKSRADRRQGVRQAIKLSPNTIYDIASTAVAAGNHAVTAGLSVVTIPSVAVAGTTSPINRTSRGRYLTLDEIALLIDGAAAARHRHLLHLLLLVLGCGVRVGAVGMIETGFVKADLDVINLLDEGEVDLPKRKPIVPVTGPMGWVIAECAATAGRDNRLIHYRAQGINGNNWTQSMNRIKSHALRLAAERGWPDERIVKMDDRVNWTAVRRTVLDWLRNYVPAKHISAVAGHVQITQKDRELLFEEGSPTTEIYKRRALEPVYVVGDVFERKWWPELQKRIQSDLRLDADAGRMQSLLQHIEKDGEYGF